MFMIFNILILAAIGGIARFVRQHVPTLVPEFGAATASTQLSAR